MLDFNFAVFDETQATVSESLWSPSPSTALLTPPCASVRDKPEGWTDPHVPVTAADLLPPSAVGWALCLGPQPAEPLLYPKQPPPEVQPDKWKKDKPGTREHPVQSRQ